VPASADRREDATERAARRGARVALDAGALSAARRRRAPRAAGAC
jgi:hypothetical protein